MRFPRMTTRRWMMAVAAVAISLGGWLWFGEIRRRSEYYSALADAYALEAENHSALVGYYLNKAKAHPGSMEGTHYYPDFQLISSNHEVKLGMDRRAAGPQAIPRLIDPDPGRHAEQMQSISAREKIRADYFARLKAKYHRAASRPWFTAPPDPPPPM
jgi:hypothetical protein